MAGVVNKHGMGGNQLRKNAKVVVLRGLGFV